MSVVCSLACLSLFFVAVLRFSTYSAVFARICGFNSIVRLAISCQGVVWFFGFWLFSVATLRCCLTNANTSQVSFVFLLFLSLLMFFSCSKLFN